MEFEEPEKSIVEEENNKVQEKPIENKDSGSFDGRVWCQEGIWNRDQNTNLLDGCNEEDNPLNKPEDEDDLEWMSNIYVPCGLDSDDDFIDDEEGDEQLLKLGEKKQHKLILSTISAIEAHHLENIELEEPEDDPLKLPGTFISDPVAGPSSRTPTSAASPTKNKKNLRKWRFRKKKFEPPVSTWMGCLAAPPKDEMTPYEYFKSFFTDELFNLISAQSNSYAHQKDGVVLNSTGIEYEKVVGIWVLMGIVKMPSMRLYWAAEFRYPPISDIMSRDRFLQLLKYFHFADNEQMPKINDINFDRLYKVRPILSTLLSGFRAIPPEEYNSVDEQIIPFKGRSVLKQHMKNKPHKWGYKVFTRAGISGIIYDFKIYVGKNTCADFNIGFSGNIVLDLIQDLPTNLIFKVAADNWFSSIDLVKALKDRGILYVGTIRCDRTGKCPLKSEAELKKQGRGAYDCRVEDNENIALVRWFDRKAINFISSYAAIEPRDTCRRFNAAQKKFINILRPHVVAEYNKFMGGVDLVDMLVELYRINIKSTKWYMRIILWCIGITVANSWNLYRRHSVQRGTKIEYSLLSFQSSISHGLREAGKLSPRKRGRPSLQDGNLPSTSKKPRATPTVAPIADVRYDCLGHFPEMLKKKGRCKLCIKCATKMHCLKCDARLCLTSSRNCFLNFHTKKNQGTTL